MARVKEQQKQRASKRATEEEPQASGEAAAGSGGKSAAVSEDAECCLAEIDEVLAEQLSEESKAREEFEVIRQKFADAIASDADVTGLDDLLRAWQARNSHLGLRAGYCCGVPFIEGS